MPVRRQESCGGAYECTLERRFAKPFEKVCAQNGWRYTVLSERGAAVAAKKALRRPGLIVGLILAVIALFESSCFVWDIKISGNETLSNEEVRAILPLLWTYHGKT